MSGGANKSFLADTVNWLRNNVLLIDVQGMTGATMNYAQGALVTCNIKPDKSKSAKVTGGRTRLVYRVEEATGTANKYSHRFAAYYLPFRSNDLRTMRLDPVTFPPGANFFFTDTVNGCSFAGGPGATPKVGHFNRTQDPRDPGSAIDQPAMNADIAHEFGGGTVVKLTKATYKPGTADYASVIGIKTGAAWSFYWQGPRSWVGIKNGEKEWEVPANMLTQCDNNG